MNNFMKLIKLISLSLVSIVFLCGDALGQIKMTHQIDSSQGFMVGDVMTVLGKEVYIATFFNREKNHIQIFNRGSFTRAISIVDNDVKNIIPFKMKSYGDFLLTAGISIIDKKTVIALVSRQGEIIRKQKIDNFLGTDFLILNDEIFLLGKKNNKATVIRFSLKDGVAREIFFSGSNIFLTALAGLNNHLIIAIENFSKKNNLQIELVVLDLNLQRKVVKKYEGSGAELKTYKDKVIFSFLEKNKEPQISLLDSNLTVLKTKALPKTTQGASTGRTIVLSEDIAAVISAANDSPYVAFWNLKTFDMTISTLSQNVEVPSGPRYAAEFIDNEVHFWGITYRLPTFMPPGRETYYIASQAGMK